MKVGAIINPQGADDEDPEAMLDGLLGMARAADEAGFDHVTGGQHYLSDFTQLQLLPYLSRLTGEIDVPELSTGAVVLPFHHPVDLAERIATIDRMHGGRTVLGVAAGYRPVEFDSFGVPREERIPRLIEGIELTRALLSGEDVAYDGRFYSVAGATLPVHPADEVPIWIAANADPAVERAARLGDAWLVNPHSTLTEIAEQKREYYDPVRDDRDEDASVPVMREAFVAPTAEEAIEVARPHLAAKYERYVSWDQHEAMEDPSELRQGFDRLAEDRFLLGTPAEVAAELERYERELGASHVLLRVHWPGLDYGRARECLELIGDEVLPIL